MKARRIGDDHLILLERLTPLADVERPNRVLRRFGADGSSLDYVPPTGATLADFAAHPHGEVSILLANDVGYALERWMADGSRSGAIEITGVVPSYWSRDAGRIAPVADDVVLAVRTSDNSVRTSRFAPDGATYRMIWDTLVEPPNDLLPIRLTSGSFDTFGQLGNRFHTYIDVGSDGSVWVGVLVDPGTDLIERHDDAFGDDLHSITQVGFSSDVLVTRLDCAGRRVFSRVVGTPWNDEIYGMRAVGGDLMIAGRTETTPEEAGGWDGLLASVTDGGTVFARTVNVDAADIFFDADVLTDGRIVAIGGTGYTDNPTGGSISETCAFLALVLTGDVQTRLTVPSAPRHNHLRTLLAGAASVWVAGMSDGPGTHSGDADPSVIYAEPFVAALRLP
jgi:hypothetical protein